MPKKGKVNKLARMSDEERARYLQHRADIEEEARRRKNELIARFIKNKLDKEEAFSKTNAAKLNQIWRYMLRRIKCKQMATEIEGLMKGFNFMIERKDRLINTLVDAIGEADEQHRRSFQAHMETISEFIFIGSQRLDKIQEVYDSRKDTQLLTWQKDETDIGESQERDEQHLKLIQFIQNSNYETEKKLKALERASALNDARLEHEEDMRNLRRPKDDEIEQYVNSLRQVYKAYMDQHNPMMNHYQLLKEKDEFYQRDIARNERLIHQSTKLVLSLQNQHVKFMEVSQKKLGSVHEQKEALSKRHWQLKKETKLAETNADQQMILLVEASQAAIERLEEATSKLDKIQHLADICSKYENEADQVVVTVTAPDDNQGDVQYENLDEAMIDYLQCLATIQISILLSAKSFS